MEQNEEVIQSAKLAKVKQEIDDIYESEAAELRKYYDVLHSKITVTM